MWREWKPAQREKLLNVILQAAETHGSSTLLALRTVAETHVFIAPFLVVFLS